MTPYALEDLFKANPGQAFRLKLNSGDEVFVDNPGRALILDLQLYIGQAEDPNSLVGRTLKVISITNISIVEPIDRTKHQVNVRAAGGN